MLTTIETQSFLVPTLLMYSGTPAITQSVLVQNEDIIVVEITADDEDVQYDIAYGEPLHPAVTEPGVYVEFFLPGQNGNRNWQTGSFIGLPEDRRWTITVGQRGPASFIVVFSYSVA